MQLNILKRLKKETINFPEDQIQQLEFEKLTHIQQSAKKSLIPAFIGPFLCIPLFASTAGHNQFYLWFSISIFGLLTRAYLINSINFQESNRLNLLKANWAIGISSFSWGLGWLLILPTPSFEKYLLYSTVTLIFILINIYGNCINWSTTISLIMPVQVGLFSYYFFIPNAVNEWPVVTGMALFTLYSLKLGLAFSNSWQKNILLRFKNESLLKELTIEKNASIAANIAKSDFIATASHDLRQPMQAINILLALIDGEKMTDHDRQALIKKLKVSADHLNKMFKTLLDISKLDAQSIQVKESRFKVQSLIDDLKNIFQPIANQKQLNLIFNSEISEVLGDQSLLQQVLTNLISNSLQYSNAGIVTVEFNAKNDKLLIQVSDTGCGISKDDLNSIYKEFYRSPNTRTMHDGLGLGLSIVKRIANLINGTLSATSELGKGTTFTLETTFEISNSSNDPNIQTLTSKVNAPPPILEQTSPLKSLHIAIIEDDETLIEAYDQFFRSTGFHVHLIPLAEEAFKSALLNIPHLDFILSDYRLGEKSGVDYIQMIREEFNTEIPAIIVTADTSPEHIKFFEDLNIKTLHKPIEPNSILTYIREYLS